MNINPVVNPSMSPNQNLRVKITPSFGMAIKMDESFATCPRQKLIAVSNILIEKKEALKNIPKKVDISLSYDKKNDALDVFGYCIDLQKFKLATYEDSTKYIKHISLKNNENFGIEFEKSVKEIAENVIDFMG